jgi:hypothetical protein
MNYPRLQVHLLPIIKKIHALFEYQGVLNYTDALGLFQHLTHFFMTNYPSCTSLPI